MNFTPAPIAQAYRPGRSGLSFEVFPPKTVDGDSALWENVERLSRFSPAFISCTYGAGGSTRTRTIEICREIQGRFAVTATAHFTCLGGTREELRDWLRLAQSQRITNIMALRGDPPAGETSFRQVEGGLSHANELVALIRDEFKGVGIGVAGYPEKHPEAPSIEADLDNLKRKVAAGADAVFTQLFFVNDSYFAFRERCDRAGITVPIVPGIMPVLNFAQIRRITSLCGAVLPPEFAARLEAFQEDKQAQFEIGVEYAINQCRELLEYEVPGIHFYVLNRAQACEAILASLGHAPAAN
jgi:methylenetetrahydrofolate reductase (NADPH)